MRNQALEEAARVASQNGHYGNLLASSIRALKLPQADKDGGQQHEGVVTDDMRYAVRFAPSSAHWSERLMEFFGPDAREGIDALERQLREARTMLDRQTNLPSGWQLALNLAIDAIENAAPGGQDWPVNWPAILHGLKDLRAALSATQTEQGERDE
ncbi:hypothetical protein LMG3412_06549 [Achromobacter deleyi]|nr:hypothetical protein LMG3412_06549 [Achromobacter deleyi]